MAVFLLLLASILVTCFSFGGGDGSLSVSKDGVDGDGILNACV